MQNWLVVVIVGVLALIAGVVALLFPLPASFTLNAFVGAGLVVTGLFGAIGALGAGPRADRLWGTLLGILILVLGGILLLNPVAGVQTLAMVFAIGFLASGVLKVLLALQIDVPGWKWSLIFSGAVSVLLAVIIFAGWPQSSAVVPGILLAVELLTYGWGLVFLGLAWRKGRLY